MHHETTTDLIPPPDVIRPHLERLDREANILRALLRLSLRREREAEREVDEQEQ